MMKKRRLSRGEVSFFFLPHTSSLFYFSDIYPLITTKTNTYTDTYITYPHTGPSLYTQAPGLLPLASFCPCLSNSTTTHTQQTHKEHTQNNV
jgi:hypothetical protein